MTDELALLRREERDGAVVVHLTGEIDLSNAEELQGRIYREVRGVPLAMVDLADVAYIDSQGLRLLKRLSDQLGSEGAKLEVVAPTGTIARDVLELTRMGEDIAIRDVISG
jgi:stage II sporulation protein AA (anti-sigma F factor antagonist)